MLSFVKVMVGMAGFQPTWMVSLLIYSQPPSSTRPHTHNIHIEKWWEVMELNHPNLAVTDLQSALLPLTG